jgi:hypothetical protein
MAERLFLEDSVQSRLFWVDMNIRPFLDIKCRPGAPSHGSPQAEYTLNLSLKNPKGERNLKKDQIRHYKTIARPDHWNPYSCPAASFFWARLTNPLNSALPAFPHPGVTRPCTGWGPKILWQNWISSLFLEMHTPSEGGMKAISGAAYAF